MTARHVIAVFTGFMFSALACGQPATRPQADPTIPPGVTAFATIHVAQVWDHPAVEPARVARGRLEFAWVTQSLLGLEPAGLDRITLIWHRPADERPYVAVTGRKAVDHAGMGVLLSRPGSAPARGNGKVIPITGSEYAYAHPLDTRTALLIPRGVDQADLADVVANLRRAESTGGGHALVLGLNSTAVAALPDRLRLPVPEARSVVLSVDLGRATATVRLRATYPTIAGAMPAEPILRAGLRELTTGTKVLLRSAEGRPPESNADPTALVELVGNAITDTTVRLSDTSLVATTTVNLDELTRRVLLAAPDAALAARGSEGAQAHLKRIASAVHTYFDEHGHTPGNVYGKDGTPLLSWRVRILPYLGEEALFRRFKLDQAWDSPANRAAARSVVRAFQVPGRPAAWPWETYFQSFTSPRDAGPHRAWLTDGEPKGPTLPEVTNADGLSNTLMVVEAAGAVPWAAPADLPYDGFRHLPKLGGPDGRFAVVFGTGDTRVFCGRPSAEKDLRSAITVAGGETYLFPTGGCGLRGLFGR